MKVPWWEPNTAVPGGKGEDDGEEMTIPENSSPKVKGGETIPAWLFWCLPLA